LEWVGIWLCNLS